MFGECTICLQELRTVAALKCGHVFHHACVLKWVSMYNNCPTCRKWSFQSEIVGHLFLDCSSSYKAVIKQNEELSLKNELLSKKMELAQLRISNALKQCNGPSSSSTATKVDTLANVTRLLLPRNGSALPQSSGNVVMRAPVVAPVARGVLRRRASLQPVPSPRPNVSRPVAPRRPVVRTSTTTANRPRWQN